MFISTHLIQFASSAKGKILGMVMMNMLITLSASAISLFTAILVDALLRGGDLRFFTSIYQIYGAIVICLVISFFMYKLRAVRSERTAIFIKDNIRIRLLNRIFSLGPGYTSGKRTGALTSTLTTKVESLKYYYANYLPVAIATILNGIIFLSALFRIDSVSAGVASLAFVCMLGVPMCFFHLMKGLGKSEWKEREKYYSDCLDGIQGVRALKAMNANATQIKRIAAQGEALRKAVMSHLKATMTEGAVLELFSRAGSSITVVVVVLRHIGGAIPAENTIYAYFFIAACFTPMVGLINAWHLGFMGVSASYHIADLLNESVNNSLMGASDGLHDVEHSTEDCISGDIVLSDIVFAYAPEDGAVIHDLNITIPQGSMTALVGPSGSGKSTIAHLLAGFYMADNGTIRIGNTILDRNTVASFQDCISSVWQDSHLFYGTVYENILMGKESATQEDVYAAAKEANLHDFILSLPNGYETMVGERGMRFSGGERQRVAIARAYLRNTGVLIFDEATSALDRQNELDIQDSFFRLSRGKTSLVIAHRLSTIMHADQICVIQKGRVMASGKHDELIRTSDIYQNLVNDQIVVPDVT